MFICALSEKLLRLFYMSLIKDSLYVPINKATLGDLLSESNDDMSVLQEAPFTDYGSIVEVFTDLSVWAGIRQAIEQVNANALAA